MRTIAILAIAVGLVFGIVGGIIADESLLSVGAVVAIVGVIALWALAILKSPVEVLKAQAEVESMASGYPTDTFRSATQPGAESARPSVGLLVPHNEHPIGTGEGHPPNAKG